jgi:dipeptidyl aminopeptidase/acylaminoacyl peptidase
MNLVVAHIGDTHCGSVYQLPPGATNRQLYQDGVLTFARRGTLFAVEPSGATRRRPVPAKAAFAGVWSPSGQYVAVGGTRLRIFSATSPYPVATAPIIHDGASYAAPAWSADGRWLAFVAEWVAKPGGIVKTKKGLVIRSSVAGVDVVVMRTNGTGARTVFRYSSTRGGLTLPSWSPDSTVLAFTAPTARGAAIYAVERDGSSLRRLTAPAGTDDVNPIWAPDSRRIAFSREFVKANTADAYVVVDTRQAKPKRVTRSRTPPHASIASTTYALSWSPDGSTLLLARPKEIATVSADGGHLSTLCTLTSDAFAQQGTWIP